jgi:hypothetical protein
MGRLIQYNSQVAKHHPNGSTHIITYSVNILPLHMQGKPGRVFRHALGKNKKIAQNHIEARGFRNVVAFFKTVAIFWGSCRTVSDGVPACHGTYNKGFSVPGRVRACPQNNIVTPPDLGMFWWKYGFSIDFTY